MESILCGSSNRSEISPRKRAHSSTTNTTDDSTVSTTEPSKPSSPLLDEVPAKKKLKIIDEVKTPSSITNNNDRPKSPILTTQVLHESKELKEVSKQKEPVKPLELDPLASLAAFERPSTSSSSSLVSLDDEDELEKRLVLCLVFIL